MYKPQIGDRVAVFVKSEGRVVKGRVQEVNTDAASRKWLVVTSRRNQEKPHVVLAKNCLPLYRGSRDYGGVTENFLTQPRDNPDEPVTAETVRDSLDDGVQTEPTSRRGRVMVIGSPN